MSRAGVAMEVGSDGVAVITMWNPPVNALAPSIFAGLKEKYVEAMKRNDVNAIVLTGDGGKFSGGFDINVFAEVHKTGDVSILPDDSINLLASTIEDANKPSVAAIHGLALGGGLELAMCCHARISTPDAQLGLPELTLGVIPGFGGTQRLPRLVGLPKAVEMMLLSKSIRAKEGTEYGLVDATTSPENLLIVSRQWALEIAERSKPWISSLKRTDKLTSLSEARKILHSSGKHAKKISPNMPQNQVCLDAIEEGIVFGGYAGLMKEARLFKEIILTTTARSLVHAFFAERATSKVPNVSDVGLKSSHIRKVAVIGGGLMGSGIATALILNGLLVILKEIDSTLLQRGIKTITANLEGLMKKGSLTLDKKNEALTLLKGVLDYSEFKEVDMVIEAVIEKVPLKQSIFNEIENICPRHCILATNTSTIDLNIVGERTKSQDRIVGAHFFSPAHVMPLLEIVRTEKTSPQVILDLMTVGKIIKKVPVVVGNCTGFAVNRTFFPYNQAAQMLLHLGVDLYRIDRVIRNFGMPMGPFQLQDVAGYGVALAVKPIFASSFKGRTFETDLLELMIQSGRNGKANGKGYYLYQSGSKPKPDPSIQTVIDESRKRTLITSGVKPVSVSDQEIVEMIFFPVVNEACRVMDEGVVVRASDIDVASILGMGFPKYRGGLVFWADTIGSSYIYSKLKKLEDAYGRFFTPSKYLEDRAANGLPLSSANSSLSQALQARL
ncbi:peroxisomal fatty acid beta-oxidation multifunctional protein isoform X2 [Dendrobium catenatum]|uniref:Peroxisomal fatty acid beta-oxidation multifunctional protein n=1 Tax=Dendrobium catenatum TaxID=906689 RepID=A0A2I0XDD9_9ASPA|nr:peroxisomal fatty acid beta-oxidation multifunctional protein isoform X2 [Dendrobium catenatum]PKU85919.1 Peroxisomal fatty acid beta-oxidation multifunctional protein [Dendrobium catenatum]